MQDSTDQARGGLADLARKHGFSVAAVEALAKAMSSSGGSMAQFNNAELGGMGQWSPGMLMIGEMSNDGLKGRVSALASDVSQLVKGGGVSSEPSQRGPVPESVSLFVPSGGSSDSKWWPSDLGQPSSAGSQNDMHYASFPDAHRLAIRVGGRTTIYDSADHVITGVAQAQGGGQSLTFTSQHGLVRINELKVVG